MPISDRFTTLRASRARLLALAPATCLLFSQPLAAQHSSLAQAELQRRAANAAEAQELLIKGDEAYNAGKWSDAIAAYGGARELLPDAPATAAQRKAATERLVQASVEQARHQSKRGDVRGAGETIDKVLAEGVAPDDGFALEMQEQLNDPIRTNPAATLELTEDVEEVRLGLYKAEGFYNLGEYDQAARAYEDVLRVDPHNKAARRGMEQVTQSRADYYRAAYDEARASMLGEVDEAWQLRVRPSDEIPGFLETGDRPQDSRMLIANKLDLIRLPMVDLESVTLREALDFLRMQSVELDTLELDPARKGVNFVMELGAPDSETAKAIQATKITLQLRDVPLSTVLKYIGEITRTVSVPQEFAVSIRPAGASATDMITRVYKVPPDFLTAGGPAAGEGAGGGDPFADDATGEGLLAKRLTADEVLKQQGVPFPEGATATFNAANSTLRVNNTITNHSMIEQIVEAAASTEPAMVLVEVKVIKTQDRVLEELGFDWLLGEFSLGGSGLTPGAPAGTLSGGDLNPENLLDVPVLPGQFNRYGITGGNRSGNEGILGDSIDDLIAQQASGVTRGSARAPGVLAVNGLINDANVTMLMRGLSQKKGIDLAVSPATATRSGQQSTIEVIREFIYPTEYEPPELPNTVDTPVLIDFDTGDIEVGTPPLIPITPATPTSFTMKPVGMVLDVLPTVSADRHYIDIALKPTLTDFDGFINYGTPITSPSTDILGNPTRVTLTSNEILMPVFSVMKTETNLTVADGATFVIGGMLQEKLQKVQDKTQILGDLPLIGRLFRDEAYAPVRTAVVFLVTVKVVDPTGQPFRNR